MLLRKVQLSSVLGQQFVRFTQKWVLLLFLSNIIEKKKTTQSASSLSPAMSC